MSAKLNILVVEDDFVFMHAFATELRKHGNVFTSQTIAKARSILESQAIDLAFVDISFEGQDLGLKLLKETVGRGIYSVVVSSYQDSDIIESVYEMGAKDYFAKSTNTEKIAGVVQKFKKKFSNERIEEFFEEDFLTRDPDTKENILDILNRDTTNKSILLLGPTGIGKTKIAKLIHKLGSIAGDPFVEVNCSAIPEHLFESEFFGYDKGAFTGANVRKVGKLEEANGGTIFLDEIGTMPPNIQNKLLKAIDEKSFSPVGSNRGIKCSFRIISATCEDLAQMLQTGLFRRDLLSRLEAVKLDLKPISQRSKDIPMILNKLLERNSIKQVVIKKEALKVLTHYHWPKNVREMEQLVHSWTDKGLGLIKMEHIPQHIVENRLEGVNLDSLFLPQHMSFIHRHGLKAFLEQMKVQAVNEALKQNQNNLSLARTQLKIPKSSFYKKNAVWNSSIEEANV